MNCSSTNISTALERTRHEGLNFLIIPAALLTGVTLLLDLLLLVCILGHRHLCKETRYLLLANVFLSDTLFLSSNFANIACNMLQVKVSHMFCELIMVSKVTTCCSTILTLTLMVVDTYLAVRCPLRYTQALRPRHAMGAVAAVWLVAAFLPFALLLLTPAILLSGPPVLKDCVVLVILDCLQNQMHINLHVYFTVMVFLCTALICYCYMRLYLVTRSSGIWRSRYSRARTTLLLHALVLTVYFTPCFVFTAQLGLQDTMEAELAVWLDTVNVTVLLVMSRASAPCLYGLRYREIYRTVWMTVGRRHPSHIS
ncbi:probable G-protein coupled receptor 148 [Electrophorus electricus]|uniref:probable G-protein coupled receptor 148 n=1 Tax=Electrophorus electricus TaxID=8005 RepID=UPI0015D04BB9|nr:probable G-protein coupled receptor 148 [Electrophorus electricus]